MEPSNSQFQNDVRCSLDKTDGSQFQSTHSQSPSPSNRAFLADSLATAKPHAQTLSKTLSSAQNRTLIEHQGGESSVAESFTNAVRSRKRPLVDQDESSSPRKCSNCDSHYMLLPHHGLSSQLSAPTKTPTLTSASSLSTSPLDNQIYVSSGLGTSEVPPSAVTLAAGKTAQLTRSVSDKSDDIKVKRELHPCKVFGIGDPVEVQESDSKIAWARGEYAVPPIPLLLQKHSLVIVDTGAPTRGQVIGVAFDDSFEPSFTVRIGSTAQGQHSLRVVDIQRLRQPVATTVSGHVAAPVSSAKLVAPTEVRTGPCSGKTLEASAILPSVGSADAPTAAAAAATPLTFPVKLTVPVVAGGAKEPADRTLLEVTGAPLSEESVISVASSTAELTAAISLATIEAPGSESLLEAFELPSQPAGTAYTAPSITQLGWQQPQPPAFASQEPAGLQAIPVSSQLVGASHMQPRSNAAAVAASTTVATQNASEAPRAACTRETNAAEAQQACGYGDSQSNLRKLNEQLRGKDTRIDSSNDWGWFNSFDSSGAP